MGGAELPTLGERTKALIINIVIFYFAFVVATGDWSPTGGLESVWLLSALALWFLGLLSAPYFVPPRDALANGITAASILVTADLSKVENFQTGIEIIRWAAVGFAAAIVLLSLFALFMHGVDRQSAWGRLSFRLTGTFGKGELLYTPPAIISIIGAYQPRYALIAALLMLWTFFVVARPAERVLNIRRQWLIDRGEKEKSPAIGVIERIDHPNIVRVRLTKTTSWKPGSLFIAATPNGDQQYVLSLFTQVQGSEVMGTGLCVAPVQELITCATGDVHECHTPEKAAEFIENLSGATGARLVGFTVENSTIGTINFEVATSSELAEGDVVFARINGRDVFYQILDAETAEESFDQNPRGTHIVSAAQLGCYSPDRGFTKYPWLPAMNSPLFIAKDREFPPPMLSPREIIIGDVPATKIGAVANVDDLVEYHTAILGVTGTGKTELTLDLVRASIDRGIKVFCVDFTGEYRARLADLNPVFPSPTPAQISDLETKLFAAETAAYGGKQEKGLLAQHINTVRTTVSAQIETFLTDDAPKLAILELTEISNTKASLRLTELYLSTIMAWARNHRKARQILIVLEEAHTVIPEMFSSGFDNETQWVVSRIGQIALQGRKYGVGLLVVSQRTALVSKTILSQCNTFFTHSLVDQTSLTFLESVYSKQHTLLIPNLGQFEFLAFGKALRLERPAVLRRPFDQAKKDASDRLRRPLAAPPAEQ